MQSTLHITKVKHWAELDICIVSYWFTPPFRQFGSA